MCKATSFNWQKTLWDCRMILAVKWMEKIVQIAEHICQRPRRSDGERGGENSKSFLVEIRPTLVTNARAHLLKRIQNCGQTCAEQRKANVMRASMETESNGPSCPRPDSNQTNTRHSSDWRLNVAPAKSTGQISCSLGQRRSWRFCQAVAVLFWCRTRHARAESAVTTNE